jgi:hypothetical protein
MILFNLARCQANRQKEHAMPLDALITSLVYLLYTRCVEKRATRDIICSSNFLTLGPYISRIFSLPLSFLSLGPGLSLVSYPVRTLGT